MQGLGPVWRRDLPDPGSLCRHGAVSHTWCWAHSLSLHPSVLWKLPGWVSSAERTASGLAVIWEGGQC